MVLAGIVDRRGGQAHCRAVLQIMVEQRQDHFLAKLFGGVAAPLERAETAAVAVDLAVAPRPHDEEIVAGLALCRERLIRGDRAVHILLVPQPLFPDRRHVGRVGSEQFVERLPLPEGVIRGMRQHPLPIRQLRIAGLIRPRPGRADIAEIVVIVIPTGRRHAALGLVAGLPAKPRDVGEAKRAVMEPVIAHPSIDHRAFRRGDLQRGMRIEQRHRNGEALIRRSDHPDATVRFRQVCLVHQPIDRVIGIGDMIDFGRVERADHRAGDHIIPLRSVFAANVLIDADIAVAHEHLVGQRQRRKHAGTGRALGATAGVIRRARQDDRCVLGILGNDDDREQLGPVAHRDHHLAAHIIVRSGRRRKFRRNVICRGWGGRRRRCSRTLGRNLLGRGGNREAGDRHADDDGRENDLHVGRDSLIL